MSTLHLYLIPCPLWLPLPNSPLPSTLWIPAEPSISRSCYHWGKTLVHTNRELILSFVQETTAEKQRWTWQSLLQDRCFFNVCGVTEKWMKSWIENEPFFVLRFNLSQDLGRYTHTHTHNSHDFLSQIYSCFLFTLLFLNTCPYPSPSDPNHAVPLYLVML